MIAVAVPVKDLANAKARLTSFLDPGQRRELARAMLRDVLRTLAVSRFDLVWVVTQDAEVAALARGLGAEVLPEEANRGHTAAVGLAQREATRRGVGIFVTVPGDVPCATTEELQALARAATGGAPIAILTPSRTGRGTNGVALAPADAMTLTFGEPSFENHVALAHRLHLGPRVLPLPGLSLDIDTPEDLELLASKGGATETGRLLATWNITSRTGTTASSAGGARANLPGAEAGASGPKARSAVGGGRRGPLRD